MTANLPTEVLHRILKLVSQNRPTIPHSSKNDLYTCIFVNHEWCQVAMPILWNRPFSTNNEQRTKVITVFLAFLSEDERRRLLPRRFWGRSFWKNVFPRARNSWLPLFDYPHFVKRLDYVYMHLMIIGWCQEFRISSSVLNVHKALLTVMKRCDAYIDRLVGDYASTETTRPFFKCLLENPDLSQWLAKSVKSCDLTYGPNLDSPGFLDIISLKEMSLDSLTIVAALSPRFGRCRDHKTLIDSILSIKSVSTLLFGFYWGDLHPIINAIAKHRHSLRRLNLVAINFRESTPLEGFAQLVNLEELVFDFCSYFTRVAMEPLCNANLPRLQSVELLGCKELLPEFDEWLTQRQKNGLRVVFKG